MTLSSGIWHPVWYESWSVLAFCLYPLFVFPLFQRAEGWRTSAPTLLVLLPMFHSTTLAFLAIRSVFIGMAYARIDRPGAAVAAGVADVHGLLEIGAAFSLLVLVVALIGSRRNRPLPGIAKGRAVAIAIVVASCLLTGGVLAMTYVILAGPSALRWRVVSLVMPGVYASAALVVFTIGAVTWLIRRSARGDLPVTGTHRPVLALCFASLAAIGIVAWLAQDWLRNIARTGF